MKSFEGLDCQPFHAGLDVLCLTESPYIHDRLVTCEVTRSESHVKISGHIGAVFSGHFSGSAYKGYT